MSSWPGIAKLAVPVAILGAGGWIIAALAGDWGRVAGLGLAIPGDGHPTGIANRAGAARSPPAP